MARRPKNALTLARFGFAYYLDGGFKAYVFNNVAWGKTSDLTSPLCATSAFHELIGFMNALFNNTAYRFAAPFRRQASLGGHSAFLGNLRMDSSELIFRHADITAPEDTSRVRTGVRHDPTESMAYANNVFVRRPRVFGFFDLDIPRYARGFRAGLAEDGSLASRQAGWSRSLRCCAPRRVTSARAPGRPSSTAASSLRPLVAERGCRRMAVLQLPADPTRFLARTGIRRAVHVRETYYRVPLNDLRPTTSPPTTT